jgi:hypothetical protein
MLEDWTRAQEALDYHEALDDPLVLAEYDAKGMCLVGKVTHVDLAHREVKPGNKKATQVPLVTLKLEHPTRLLPGTEVRWTADPRVEGTLRSVAGHAAELAIVAGHKSGTRVPALGDEAVFTELSIFGGLPPDSPEEVPWTHRGPADEETGAGDDPAAALPDDGTPDLPVEELAQALAIGLVAPDEAPTVLA